METDKGLALTKAERTALNLWIYRLVCEQSGPSLPLTVNNQQRLLGIWEKNDIYQALMTVSEELATTFCEVTNRFRCGSSHTWEYLGQHHPKLIVECIKAGAFKEIGDEDADNRDD